MTIYFRNCLYIPTLGYNLLSTDALYNNSGTKTFLNGDKTIELAGGGTLHMSHCNTFLVTPLPADAVVQQHVLATFVTRGKDGPTHIDANPLSAKDELEFRLWSARLNDPAPARLRAVHEVLDNVPGVLRKANMNNTATDARMLANAPAMATHRRATPIATRPGEITQIDLCTMPCTSILGNKYLLSAYDNATGDFEFYPIDKKSTAPAAVNQYYLDAKAAGVDIDKGGVLYSDNEIVLNSEFMDEVS